MPFNTLWAHLKPNLHCYLDENRWGTLRWYNSSGALHRVDANGIQDGPACIYPDGTQYWYLNGRYHRLDGPACIYPGGIQYFYLDGVRLTQEEWARDPRVVEYHSQTPEEAEQWLRRL